MTLIPGSVINKEVAGNLYQREQTTAEIQFWENWYNLLERVGELIDITIPDSLVDVINIINQNMAEEDAALQEQIDEILSGELLSGLTLPEAQIIFEEEGHDHSGGESGAKISHPGLLDVTPNDHHSQVHDIIGPDHSGPLDEIAVTFDPVSGHSHEGIDSRPIDHDNIINVGPDDHHPEVHDLQSHTGDLSAALVTVGEVPVDDVLSAIEDEIAYHTGLTATLGHDLSLDELVDLGVAVPQDLIDHEADTYGHGQVYTNEAAIAILQEALAEAQATLATAGIDIIDLQAAIVALGGEVDEKTTIDEVTALITAWTGALGSVAPIVSASFVDVEIDGVLSVVAITNLAELIVGDLVATSIETDSLTVTTTITLPEGSVAQGAVATETPETTYNNTPVTLVDDLGNVRAMLGKLAGEPWDMDAAANPDFTATSAFAGLDLKTQEELQWYRMWLAGSLTCNGLVVDTFFDDSLQGSGDAVIADHQMGTGIYETSPVNYTSAELYDVDYVIFHVEASDPATLIVEVTANAGDLTPDWTLIPNARFDKVYPINTPGKSIKVRITSAAGYVYSYGVLLGGEV